MTDKRYAVLEPSYDDTTYLYSFETGIDLPEADDIPVQVFFEYEGPDESVGMPDQIRISEVIGLPEGRNIRWAGIHFEDRLPGIMEEDLELAAYEALQILAEEARDYQEAMEEAAAEARAEFRREEDYGGN